MPTVSNTELSLLDAIDQWRIVATEAVDDIGGWRAAPNEKLAWDPPPSGIATARLASEISTYGVNLAAPMIKLADAVRIWGESRSAAGLPPQGTLEGWLADALSGLAAVQDRILRPPANAGHPDGFEEPCYLWTDGQRHELSRQVYLVAKATWRAPSITEEAFSEAVWDRPDVASSSFRPAISRFMETASKLGLSRYFDLHLRNGHIVNSAV